jgi:hypothetical protein
MTITIGEGSDIKKTKKKIKKFFNSQDDRMKEFLFVKSTAGRGDNQTPTSFKKEAGLFTSAVIESAVKKSGENRVKIDYNPSRGKEYIDVKTRMSENQVKEYKDDPVGRIVKEMANIDPHRASEIFKNAIGELE